MQFMHFTRWIHFQELPLLLHPHACNSVRHHLNILYQNIQLATFQGDVTRYYPSFLSSDYQSCHAAIIATIVQKQVLFSINRG